MPSISHFIRWNQVRRIHSTAAFTLVFALVAGLACDEKEPTGTYDPVSPSVSEAALASQGDVSAMAIALPVNQNVSTAAPNPAFRINQTGSGPNGIFQISPSTNTQTALHGLTSGRGRAGFFRILNTANAEPALHGQTNGSGTAVHGIATGTGGAGLFEVLSSASPRTSLIAYTTGNGMAAFFQISKALNSNPALSAFTFGRGPAGRFQINNVNNTTSAVLANTNGRGAGVTGIASAAGGVGGSFSATHPAAFGLTAQNIEGGVAAIFNNIGPSRNNYALRVLGNLNDSPVLAGYFNGNVKIDGTLTKTAGSFRIDHPLDPEHKYLSHSFVESPDMMNVYNGNATLDENGRATVELPEYFEALNRDFRYQLTAIGAPGPNLYIAEGVKQNQFRIAGGRPYATVSWQVTGVRQDAYANEHRIKVEEGKPEGEKKPPQGDLVARR
jgi:hypothetical protein